MGSTCGPSRYKIEPYLYEFFRHLRYHFGEPNQANRFGQVATRPHPELKLVGSQPPTWIGRTSQLTLKNRDGYPGHCVGGWHPCVTQGVGSAYLDF